MKNYKNIFADIKHYEQHENHVKSIQITIVYET